MRQSPDNGKYLLENQLRTWSELKRKAVASNNANSSSQAQAVTSPAIPTRKWGGCHDGCHHHDDDFPRRRKNTQGQDLALPPPAVQTTKEEKSKPTVAIQSTDESISGDPSSTTAYPPSIDDTTDTPDHPTNPESKSEDTGTNTPSGGVQLPNRLSLPRSMSHSYGRDAGGSLSGAATPAEGLSDVDSDGGNNNPYFSTSAVRNSTNPSGFHGTRNAPTAHGRGSMTEFAARPKVPRKKPTEHDLEMWARQSGMGSGARADPLGDEADTDGDGDVEGDDEEGGDPKEVEREMAEDQSVEGSVY